MENRFFGLSEMQSSFSISFSSFTLGFSEFYGAGGSASLRSIGGIAITRLNALYPGFGATGEWILQPQPTSPKQISYESEAQPNIQWLIDDTTRNVLETKLWASSILRDNMVTVFGYLLNIPNNPLPSELYTSLFYIYTDIRYRRVHTLEIVPILNELAYVNVQSQFIVMFTMLRKHSSVYLHSGCELWIRMLRRGHIDLESILRPGGEPLIVDFLAGIDPSVLPTLKETVEFHPDIVKQISPISEQLVGRTLSCIFSAIANEAMPLSQSLFALLLLHRPNDEVVPHREETERYLVDVLRLNNVHNWDEILNSIRVNLKDGPYVVARAVLAKISEMSDVDELIRDKARYVLQYLGFPTGTYANPQYILSSKMLSKPTIDVLLLLKAITWNEYPRDVVDIRQRLEFYIRKGFIDVEYVIKGFNRFDHTKPVDVLIAFLTRIECRLPKLPHEIISSVKYLKQYLVFKKYLCSFNPKVPNYLIDVETLVNSFGGPNIPQSVTDIVIQLGKYLPNENIPWTSITGTISIEACSQPRQCILTIFKAIIRQKVLKEDSICLNLIMQIIQLLDHLGNPLPIYMLPKPRSEIVIKYPILIKPQKPTALQPTTGATPTVVMSVPDSIPPQDATQDNVPQNGPTVQTIYSANASAFVNVSMTEVLDVQSDQMDAKPSPVTEIPVENENQEILYVGPEPKIVDKPKIYPGPEEQPVSFPQINVNVETDISDVKQPCLILPETTIGTPEDIMLRPIRIFLMREDLYQLLGSDFQPSQYVLKGELLKAILQKALTLKFVQFETSLHETITKFLLFLDTSITITSLPPGTNFPELPKDFYNGPPDYSNLTALIPVTISQSPEYFKLKPIRDLFKQPFFPSVLGSSFEPQKCVTRGTLLLEILRLSMSLNFVIADNVLLKCIKEFIEHIENSLISEEEVIKATFPTFSPSVAFEPVSIENLETVLPVTIPGTAQHVKLRPLRIFLSLPNIKDILKGLAIENYSKKGELLIAILEFCMNVKEVKINVSLYAVVKEYYSFLSSQLEVKAKFTVTVNFKTVINAIPPPGNPEEEEFFQCTKNFVTQPEFHALIEGKINLTQYRTRGEVLKHVLQIATSLQTVQVNESLSSSLMYVKDKVALDGYGAQAIEFAMIEKSTENFKLDVYSIFRVFRHETFTIECKEAAARLIKFMSYDFNPQTYLPGFKISAYHTKASCLIGIFETLLAQNSVRPEVKADIKTLLPLIVTDGPGAEPVEYSTV